MVNLQPLRDMVLVQSISPEETKRGGIIIPDIAQEKPLHAKVISVGDGISGNGDKIVFRVKAGDVVLIGKYSGTEITLDNEKYIIISQEDILAIVR